MYDYLQQYSEDFILTLSTLYGIENASIDSSNPNSTIYNPLLLRAGEINESTFIRPYYNSYIKFNTKNYKGLTISKGYLSLYCNYFTKPAFHGELIVIEDPIDFKNITWNTQPLSYRKIADFSIEDEGIINIPIPSYKIMKDILLLGLLSKEGNSLATFHSSINYKHKPKFVLSF
ncbi:hypothetical protein [Anaeromicrobium sediminis]|uniref:Uncharacterized protein n=1 Tax=Anaeromicrobium sediminis TaxID=1478221 RepID=A0A267MLY9_9FIRM|nr:hypothetical protein [Anaeromicrobium sediminis]PAB59895.1 hypothetical protein CCE28_08050 [Anaeromicrobium sediminis]